ncbi:MAG: universal stress protein, partial [Devosia sp.]|nr:universal stress protein [Devosia sp.]
MSLNHATRGRGLDTIGGGHGVGSTTVACRLSLSARRRLPIGHGDWRRTPVSAVRPTSLPPRVCPPRQCDVSRTRPSRRSLSPVRPGRTLRAKETATRSLLAIDGSWDSTRATELVRNLAWPSGSIVRVLSAYHVLPFYAGLPGVILTPEVVEQTEAAFRGEAETLVRSTVERLDRPEIEAHGEVTMAPATGAIIDEARRFSADLIVVGSRGQGPFETSLLGSTSAALVDHAPCSVLVARGDTIHRILFADDGSEPAGRAGEAVRTWP